jgi:hypothetical protein
MEANEGVVLPGGKGRGRVNVEASLFVNVFSEKWSHLPSFNAFIFRVSTYLTGISTH